MKKQIFAGIVFITILLVLGFAIFKSKPAEQVHQPAEQKVVGTTPVTAEFGMFDGDDHKTIGVGAETNSVKGSRSFDVLDERQTMTLNGDVEHKRLVKCGGKYPHRVIVETLRKDRQLKRFVPTGRTEMVADHLLVRLKEGAEESALHALAATYNAQIIRSLSDARTFIIKLEAPGLDAVEEAVAYFSASAAEVAYAEPDYVRTFSAVPNDLMYGDLWGMPKISAQDAWDVTTGSKSTVVAVIDTGMDMDHPDLLANRWDNASEIAGDGLDNDGNGYVDDVHGWDFVAEDNDPEDGDGHGTHCAGTVGAVGNNANQVVGVCWQVSLMPLRAGTGEGLFDSDIVESIRYAARNGAKVLSNSYGGPGFSQTVYDAIDYANGLGSIFVAAAGNDSSNNDTVPQYPAGYDLPNVISVAATDQDDNLATFSNYGATSVDLAAPGVDIVSTYLNGETESLQGTSMACPHVAGALALYASYDPDIEPAEAKQMLLESVDPVASLSDKVVSGGRLNLFALFASANDTDKDGIPDNWEDRYGFDLNNPLDALLDVDGDFLNNLREFQNGCNPTNADSDGDSLIDGWEVRYGFNPLNVHGTLPKLQYLGFNDDCDDAYDVVVSNGYAYVADGQFGLKILNLSVPESPTLAGSYATSGSARGVAVEGDYAYVADAENGLFIIDVSDPTDPVFVSSLSYPASKVAVGGGMAFLAAGTNGLHAVDVSAPATPALQGTFDGNGDPGFMVNDVELVGSSVYLALDGGLGEITTSLTGYSVKAISDADGNRNCTAITRSGSTIHLALQNYGVLTYTLSKSKIGGKSTPGSAEDIAYNEGLIYVADGLKGLRILNGANPASITAYASYANVPAYGVTVANGYAYVAGKSSGIQIFRSSVDSDNDGMYDGWEIDNFGDLSEGAFDDADSDGIFNWGEYLANLNPNNADQDDDDLIDGFDEVQTYLTDPRKADTDDDGLSDSYELSTNGVDNIYLTDPLKADTDGDGMTDKWEIDNGLNPLVDDGDDDDDSDGLKNRDEEQAGTDPQNPDTDGDDMPDGWEADNNLDPLFDDAADDPDGDNSIAGIDLTNLGEYLLKDAVNFPGSTNPRKADSDDDLLGDNWEITNDFRVIANVNGGFITNMYITDPNNADTDGDGMPDGWEQSYYLSPVSTNGDNGAFGDMDGDGLSNYDEYLNGSNPFSSDTDNDGFTDTWERDWGTSATNAFDPVVVDDDGPFDWWMYGGQPQDPQLSDPDEDGSIDHPFDGIQEAINVASNGFTILVKEGQYYGFGNRDINPGSLQLRILAENTNDVSQTVIKSHGLGAGFIFEGGQTTNTIIRGFTIQTSLQGTDCSDGNCGEEHGIICRDASSPFIDSCVVEYCRDDGIFCTFNSSPVISNCVIRVIYEDAAIYAESGSSPKIIDSLIEYAAGGIVAFDSSGLEVRNTTIRNTSNVLGEGRGIWLTNDDSAEIVNTVISNCQGGIRMENSNPLIDRCSIVDNYAPDYYEDGGVRFTSYTNIAELAFNVPGYNDVTDNDENGGGILALDSSEPTIQNCVIANNRTAALDPDVPDSVLVAYFGLGGGIYMGQGCFARTINCTIADNVAMTRGGAFTTFGNEIEYLRNNIIWGNVCNDAWFDKETGTRQEPGNAQFNSLHCRQGPSHFDPWYCNISDGFGFVTDRFNIEQNPLFVGGNDYHITTNSPCIDAGTYYNAPLYDRDNLPRPLDGDTITNNYYTVDIGAYEYLNPYADTDLDGIKDGAEIFTYSSDPTESDSDSDGISDGYEIAFGLNASGNDALADDDNDGLSNLQEFSMGTAANNADSDGDHSPDGDEMIAGTDALDSTSYFYVSDIRPLAEGGCEIVFDTVGDRTYAVYCCSQLGGEWTLLLGGIAGNDAEAVIVDPYADGSCFYKVEVSY